MESSFISTLVLLCILLVSHGASALPANKTALKQVVIINKKGPYLGVVVPNPFELGPLMVPGVFKPSVHIPFVDLGGRRFHIGRVADRKVIVVMTGLSMLNAGITTQQLLDFFAITGIVHYGIAGSTNSSLHVGDVTIPKFWSHTGLWNWQRFGQGPNDPLSLEVNGDFTRKLGFLHFGDNNVPEGSATNLLNNVWYQPEEIFPVTGTPEVRQHAFLVQVDPHFYGLSHQLKDLPLQSCINSTSCLSSKPKIVFDLHGASANVFLDNAAYRSFLSTKFSISLVDMESAAVALVSLQNEVPFIAIRSMSDLAGGSVHSNEAIVFGGLAAQNAVDVVVKFIKLLPK
ncbi:hypothetical protein O6H91_20G054600 [Diphasiastrum complanatum]|uniref:Uncharacterized protein n=1 Tax=Diphasiastrum complanatum TaxID=34168 RepID=A0ACC2AQG1_DIPCM|nr:hypothetical protein O6H91_20G054600 [Diphasiastrum complanatum]